MSDTLQNHGKLGERIERLEELLYDIALMADGHKSSRLYVEGANVALVNIRNMAASILGLEGRLRNDGTLCKGASVDSGTKVV